MKKYNCIRFLTFIFFAMVSLPTWAQELINVAGKVVDNSQEPMIGVSIVEKGTSNGAVTDLDGALTFDVLLIYVIGLPCYVATEVLVRALIAMRDPRTQLITNSLQLGLR